ncbi:MAG: TonB-dependent receptor [Bacteroidota bacterium]|jgi:iron complex outermembrane receptor protein|nr:TonB-dependent receptor [Bacteroidota bacterium]
MRNTLFLFALTLPLIGLGQTPSDTLSRFLEPAAVTAVRATERAPFAAETLDAEEIADRNTGQDLPYVLRYTPSVVVTSDAGAGVGYTGLRIRGTDPTRINVTLNGIPINDSESQAVFWVNMPDLASATDDIQVQRGVGTSTLGAGAFGATISLNTLDIAEEAGGSMMVGGGSFNTFRTNLQWNSGRSASGWAAEGRVSTVMSDGWVDRASSDLNSFQLGLNRAWDGGSMTYTILSGRERTYQSWWGVPEVALNGSAEDIQAWGDANGYSQRQIDDLIQYGRQANYYTYEDEVDNYGQDHQQLHLEHQFGDWRLSATGHFTHGEGYFEQFKSGEDLADYLLPDVVVGDDTVTTTDLVRRRWLDNDFYGAVLGAERRWDRAALTLGAAANRYEGDHFGRVIWAENASTAGTPNYTYYDSDGLKLDRNVFARFVQRSQDGRLQTQAELQYRGVRFETMGTDNDQVAINVPRDSATFDFLNPKVGLDYRLNDEDRVFASVAIAHKEPGRNDFVDAPAGFADRAERLTDFEFGWRRNTDAYAWGLTAYHMAYTDQLIPTGALNDVGAAIRQNVPKSSRTGVEMEFGWQISDALELGAQATLSRSRIDEFTEVIYDYLDYSTVEIVHQNTEIAFSPRVLWGGQLLWHAVRPETPSGVALDLEWATQHVSDQFMDNTGKAAILPAYTVSQLRASLHLPTVKDGQVVDRTRFDVWVENALDAEYSANGYTYSYFYGSDFYALENFYYPQAGRHINMALTYSF